MAMYEPVKPPVPPPPPPSVVGIPEVQGIGKKNRLPTVLLVAGIGFTLLTPLGFIGPLVALAGATWFTINVFGAFKNVKKRYIEIERAEDYLKQKQQAVAARPQDEQAKKDLDNAKRALQSAQDNLQKSKDNRSKYKVASLAIFGILAGVTLYVFATTILPIMLFIAPLGFTIATGIVGGIMSIGFTAATLVAGVAVLKTWGPTLKEKGPIKKLMDNKLFKKFFGSEATKQEKFDKVIANIDNKIVGQTSPIQEILKNQKQNKIFERTAHLTEIEDNLKEQKQKLLYKKTSTKSEKKQKRITEKINKIDQTLTSIKDMKDEAGKNISSTRSAPPREGVALRPQDKSQKPEIIKITNIEKVKKKIGKTEAKEEEKKDKENKDKIKEEVLSQLQQLPPPQSPKK